MVEPTRSIQPRARERALWEFVYLFFGPTIWLLHFAGIYAVQSTLCTLASVIYLVPPVIVIVTALALVILAVPTLRRAGSDDRHYFSRFLRRTMRVLSLLSAVAIIWACFAALLLHPCAPLR
jgi:hypothetical protein